MLRTKPNVASTFCCSLKSCYYTTKMEWSTFPLIVYQCYPRKKCYKHMKTSFPCVWLSACGYKQIPLSRNSSTTEPQPSSIKGTILLHKFTLQWLPQTLSHTLWWSPVEGFSLWTAASCTTGPQLAGAGGLHSSHSIGVVQAGRWGYIVTCSVCVWNMPPHGVDTH